MSKRYLGIICLLYSGIFTYVVIFNKLKNFLAPSMQIYIKLAILPLFIIGLVMIFNNKVNYKFKISDLVLILPLVLLILAGDGRLTTSLASNRMTNFNQINRIKLETEEINIEKITENETIENIELVENEITEDETINFTNPYFDIIDSNYNELSSYITFSPKASKYEGELIRVKGIALKEANYLPANYFAIGKYSISCCAADATFVGFIAKYDNSNIIADKWYQLEGMLKKGKDSENYDIMYIEVINLKEINEIDEEQYIYPCYAYDNGSCKDVLKYQLEY